MQTPQRTGKQQPKGSPPGGQSARGTGDPCPRRRAVQGARDPPPGRGATNPAGTDEPTLQVGAVSLGRTQVPRRGPVSPERTHNKEGGSQLGGDPGPERRAVSPGRTVSLGDRGTTALRGPVSLGGEGTHTPGRLGEPGEMRDHAPREGQSAWEDTGTFARGGRQSAWGYAHLGDGALSPGGTTHVPGRGAVYQEETRRALPWGGKETFAQGREQSSPRGVGDPGPRRGAVIPRVGGQGILIPGRGSQPGEDPGCRVVGCQPGDCGTFITERGI